MTQTAAPLYALRMLAHGSFQMAKFSMPDFNVEATYTLLAKGSGWTCDCPAGQRTVKLRPCKHQRMMPFMMGAANLNRFYEPETRSWIEPLNPELAAMVASEASGREGNGKVERVVVEPSEIKDTVSLVAQPEPPKLKRRV